MELDLTDIKQDGHQNPFDSLLAETDGQGKEAPVESSPENKPTEQDPSQEGAGDTKEPLEAKVETNTPIANQDVPLNKDRRFKEILDNNKALERRLQEMQTSQEKMLAEMKSTTTNKSIKAPPPAFKELFGEGNEHLWEKWQTLYPQQEQVNVAEIKSQLFAELEAKQKAETDGQKQRLEWVNSEVQKLKDDGLKFDKNELLQVIETYQPTNAEGYLDFQKGFQLLELINKTKPENQRKNARKDIAAKTSPTGASEPASDDTFDLSKAREKNWDWRKLTKY